MHSQNRIDDGMNLKGFSLPRYFYGQLLDVRHFESEQEYFKGKLQLMNQMIHGYGVVCGLNVEVGDDRKSVVVAPGVAIDKCGREIVVPRRSPAVPIPARTPPEETPAVRKEDDHCCDEGEWVHVTVCFKSCETDPEPVFASGCDVVERCSAGTVRERYEIPPPRDGKAHPPSIDCRIPDLIKGNRINYAALASWVTQPCRIATGDCCIPLANVRRPEPGKDLLNTDIDISIRPVIYTLDLLFEIFLGMLGDNQPRRGGKY